MIRWELFPAPWQRQVSWLDEIREFRARVLYENGRRPAFRLSDGQYVDHDSLDQAAFHLCARIAGAVAGCVRLLPIADTDSCLTEQLIGIDGFSAALRRLGVTRAQTIEGGRWVVDPAHRAAGIGVLLAAGGIAVAEAFGYRMLCCPVGTRRKQDRVLARLGLSAVPGLPVIPVPRLDDELRVMHVFPGRLTSHCRELMGSLVLELKLTEAAHALPRAS